MEDLLEVGRFMLDWFGVTMYYSICFLSEGLFMKLFKTLLLLLSISTSVAVGMEQMQMQERRSQKQKRLDEDRLEFLKKCL